jgi:uncharacterized protein (TIGR02246 family)
MTLPELETNPAIEEARTLLERAIAAFNTRQYDAYLTAFTEDVESYTGIVTPLRWEGLSAWKALIAGLGQLASASYEQRHASYRSYNDDTVLVNAYFVFTTVAKDGKVETQTGRASTACVKVGGKWRIANQHYSPNF